MTTVYPRPRAAAMNKARSAAPLAPPLAAAAPALPPRPVEGISPDSRQGPVGAHESQRGRPPAKGDSGAATATDAAPLPDADARSASPAATAGAAAQQPVPQSAGGNVAGNGPGVSEAADGEASEGWLLFNDFAINRVDGCEIRASYGGQKLPCLVYYTRVRGPALKRAGRVVRPHVLCCTVLFGFPPWRTQARTCVRRACVCMCAAGHRISCQCMLVPSMCMAKLSPGEHVHQGGEGAVWSFQSLLRGHRCLGDCVDSSCGRQLECCNSLPKIVVWQATYAQKSGAAVLCRRRRAATDF